MERTIPLDYYGSLIVQIESKYQQRLVEVTANVNERDLGSVAKDIRAKLDNLTVPPGFEIRLAGNVEQ
jgi:HAE1 family hydrophobic/amphiphilic exporter-1